MVADHRLIQVGLERIVSPLAQSIVTEVTLQAFDHTLYRGTMRHDRLEPLSHRGIARVDMFQSIERDGDGSTRLSGAITALCLFPASQADTKPIVLLRCAVDKLFAGVANTLVVQLMSCQADGDPIGGDLLDTARQRFVNRFAAAGIE